VLGPVDNTPGVDVEIVWYGEARGHLRDLFALADDSPEQVDRYLELGRVLVAVSEGAIVGHAQLLDCDTPGHIELRSLAIIDRLQRRGIGRVLVAHAAADCRARGALSLEVATAAADTGNLRFYQLLGFRMLRVERDAFSASEGYPDGLEIGGIPLRDRVWLSLSL
jgi:GNAT superfamily N-acetyltransferase